MMEKDHVISHFKYYTYILLSSKDSVKDINVGIRMLVFVTVKDIVLS
jgi:hypothetical protein